MSKLNKVLTGLAATAAAAGMTAPASAQDGALSSGHSNLAEECAQAGLVVVGNTCGRPTTPEEPQTQPINVTGTVTGTNTNTVNASGGNGTATADANANSQSGVTGSGNSAIGDVVQGGVALTQNIRDRRQNFVTTAPQSHGNSCSGKGSSLSVLGVVGGSTGGGTADWCKAMESTDCTIKFSGAASRRTVRRGAEWMFGEESDAQAEFRAAHQRCIDNQAAQNAPYGAGYVAAAPAQAQEVIQPAPVERQIPYCQAGAGEQYGTRGDYTGRVLATDNNGQVVYSCEFKPGG